MKKVTALFLVLFLVFTFMLSGLAFSKTVTLNFIEVLTSPGRTKLLQSIISDFEKIHPNIHINLISPPYEQADQKATLMLNTNQPLDIVEVRDYTVKQFVNNKKLLNLEGYLKGWKDSKTLLPIAWQAARTVNNTAYMVPQDFYIKALFYRTDMIDKADLPKTMNELFEACKKITDPSKNQYGFAFRGKSWELKFSDLIATSFLNDIDPENIYMKKDGKPYFNDPRAIEGLKLYMRFFKETSPKDAINWGFNEQVNGFVSGITPFLIQDPDTVALVDKMLGRDKYSVIPVPVGPSGKAYPDYGFAGLGIPSYSKHKKEAWEFIKYISSPKVNAYFCKNYGPLPVHSVTYKEDDYFAKGVYTSWATMMENKEGKYVFSKFPLGSPKWPGWPQIHQADMQSLLLGKTTIDKVVNKWANYWAK